MVPDARSKWGQLTWSSISYTLSCQPACFDFLEPWICSSSPEKVEEDDYTLPAPIPMLDWCSACILWPCKLYSTTFVIIGGRHAIHRETQTERERALFTRAFSCSQKSGVAREKLLWCQTKCKTNMQVWRALSQWKEMAIRWCVSRSIDEIELAYTNKILTH